MYQGMGVRWHDQLLLVVFAAGGGARLAVAHQHRDGDPARRRHIVADVVVDVQAFLLLGALRLVPVVLEPDLHLGRRQPDDGGEVFALRRRQIPLLAEPSLQLVGLRFAEQYPSFAFLVAVAGRAGAAAVHGDVGGALVRRLVAGLLLDVLVQFFVQVDALRLHGTGGVGVEEARRAGRVRDVGDAGRRAVRTGLLLLVVVAQVRAEACK